MAAHPRLNISRAPRPWLSRTPDECAFPVEGEGADTRACCNACAAPPYCEAHRAVMRGLRAPSFEDMLRDLARFIG